MCGVKNMPPRDLGLLDRDDAPVKRDFASDISRTVVSAQKDGRDGRHC